MIQSQVMQRIAEMSKVGGALPPEEAIPGLAAVIDHLDMYSDTYEADLATLLRVGATLWELSGGGRGEALLESPTSR